jgi:hypothetical protein
MKAFLSRHLFSLSGGITLGALLIPPGLHAEQTEPYVVGEITVTADRPRNEVETLPGNHLQVDAAALAVLPVQKGIYQDLFAVVAGGYAGSSIVGSFSLRGLNQDGLFRARGVASNPLIPVMEDGAPLSDATLRYLPPVLWDLESAELLRGPQLLGPGPAGMGGALRLSTAPPAFSNPGKALLEVAENRTLRTGIAQGYVLLPDELALQVVAYHRQSEGEVTNLHDGDDSFGATARDRYQVRLIWNPNKSCEAEYDLSLVHDESRGNSLSRVRSVSGYGLFDRKTSLNLHPSYPARRNAAILDATLALPDDLELKSTTTLQQLDVKPHLDLDETPVLEWVANGSIDELHFTQDLSVARDEGFFQWWSGAYFETSGYDLDYTGIGLAPLPAGSPFRSLGQERPRRLGVRERHPPHRWLAPPARTARRAD